jgi:hypothetical protein
MTFEVLKEDTRTNARLGRLYTAHGAVETPVFMDVGTLGTVKALEPRDLVENPQSLGHRLVPSLRTRQVLRPTATFQQLVHLPYARRALDRMTEGNACALSTPPFASRRMCTLMHRRSTSGRSEHTSLQSRSGSIGSTRSAR